MGKNFYHYTKGCHLPNIVGDGYIKVSIIGCEKQEKKAVWISTNENWENTVDCQTSADTLGGKCRIKISPDLPMVTWAKYKYVGKMRPEMYDAIATSGIKYGANPDDWYASIGVVPQKYWLAIEKLIDGVWQPYYPDRVRKSELTLQELYDMCDLVLVPSNECMDFLINTDGKEGYGEDGYNAEIRKKQDKNLIEIWDKLATFKSIGIHEKVDKQVVTFMVSDNKYFTMFRVTPNGKYRMVLDTKVTQYGTRCEYTDGVFDGYFMQAMSSVPELSKLNGEALSTAVCDAYYSKFGFICGYYALNPYIMYIDLNTHGIGSNGKIVRMPDKHNENIIHLTPRHHVMKIRNGINVLDTEKSVTYPSIAYTARMLNYAYSTFWAELKEGVHPTLKRIEKVTSNTIVNLI